MSRWFRLHDDMINNPKVQMLSAERFRILINLWCLASKNNGVLPSLDHMAYSLRIEEDTVNSALSDFVGKKLIDKKGDRYIPHDWSKHQYKDYSRDRVAKHRHKLKQEQTCNDDVTVCNDV